MARTKTYDRESVVQSALPVFWARGYQQVSMDELVEATGLNTFSMYREFGSKEGFFLAAMELYYRNILRQMTRPLRESPGLAGLNQFLDGFVGPVSSPGYSGCLFMNSLTEGETVGAQILAKVYGFTTELTELFKQGLAVAQATGEVATEVDTSALADLLLCLVQGLGLFGRLRVEPARVRALVNLIKTALLK